MIPQEKYEITNGPSREELFDALRLHFHNGAGWLVSFRVKCPKIEASMLIVAVTGIHVRSQNSWCVSLSAVQGKPGLKHFEAIFYTENRCGELKILPD